MLRRSSLAFPAFAFVSFPLACTLPNVGADGGAGDAGTQTVGDQCNQIAVAFCQHVTGDCAFIDTLSDCIANETPTCCSGTACQSVSQTSPVTVNACVAAIPGQDCGSAVTIGVAGVTPCQGIPSPQ